jgi:CRISPR-associated protein Cmr4
MGSTSVLMALVAEEPIHAGAGRATGVVDLPIQREAHTGWPCVFGSGVKGALRALAEELGVSHVDVVFGPGSTHGKDHAGALLVGDARLLLLPIRSLTSHFKLVTCPAILSRLVRDMTRLGLAGAESLPVPEVEKNSALVMSAQGDLFLEELRFTAVPSDLKQIAKVISGLAYGAATSALEAQLTIVHDDDFKYLATFATPVAAHVRLDSETKTVQSGALWYEESLPPDTVLYAPLTATASRKKDHAMSSQEVLELMVAMLGGRPYLQLAGNETTGMGWCRVRVSESAGA